MAISSTANFGISGAGASASSFVFTNSNAVDASSNRVAIVIIAADNLSASDGDNNEHTSVTGGNGTWTKLGEYTNANGAAAAGGTVSMWCFQATGSNAASTNFTVNFSGAVMDKAVTGQIYTVGAGNSLRIDPSSSPIGSGLDAANDYTSQAFSGLSSKQRLWARGLGKEANSTTQLTLSTSFTRYPVTRSRNNANAVNVQGEFRISTSTGETSAPTLAVSGDTFELFLALEEYTPSAGNQDLFPSLLSNSQTFYGATVSAGVVTLSPSLFTNSQSFFAPTITASYSLTPSLLTNSQTFYGPTVSAGAVTLTPALFTNSQTFYAPTVAGAAVTLSPPLLTNSQTFYAPTLSASYTLTPSLVTNSQSFHGPTVSASNVLTPSLFTNAQTFYSPSISLATQMLYPPLFINGLVQTTGGQSRMWRGFLQDFAA